MDYETNRIITQEELNKMGEELSNYAESLINQQFKKISNDMNYEQKYKEANDKVVARFGTNVAKEIFTDLYESEDEKIRKVLINLVKNNGTSYYIDRIHKDDILAWLKKQSNPTDKVEPKFKIGEWVISTLPGIKYPHLITDIKDGYYIFGEDDHAHIASNDSILKLWTIQDAKEGEVLAYETDEEDLWIMIYWSLYEPYEGHVHYHALLVNDNFYDKGTCCICINDLKPATKKQRNLLCSKMKEAGYEWNTEKKELRKIEQKLAWSEEDERMFKSLNKLLNEASCYSCTEGIDKIIAWLKQKIGE